MSTTVTTENTFQKELVSLAIEVTRGNTHLHFFRTLFEGYNDYQLSAPAMKDLWDYTLAAHFGAALLQLARIYDASPDGLNMRYILRGIDKKKLDSASLELWEKYTNQCSKSDTLVAKLKKWRDNIIAHYNRGIALDRDAFWRQYPQVIAEAQQLIDRAFEALEWCAEAIGQPTTFQRLAEGKNGCQLVLDRLGLGRARAHI
jgi:hypothetical protein